MFKLYYLTSYVSIKPCVNESILYKHTNIQHLSVAYNNNQSEEQAEARNELWQRQKAVLESLTTAEQLVYQGMDLQNPAYDKEFGNKRNLISVTTILRGAERILYIISPQLKDPKGHGINSESYTLYKKGLDQVQNTINQALALGINTPIGMKKLSDAYTKVTEIVSLLRQEVGDMGFDFKSKPKLEDEWAE